ncbi:ABC transporter domain containing protein [Ascosphaera apis ARSEF 7405]|uniref:ABC transporter domain containing protein n=1 Tax=Ascosphaera apis ARSEF 7405 TaxID=392613 RepID=A0A168BAU6_9EURO|nr:ABC transporter domain containing protein [Ascosphaera apis ARSEF 7405]
MMSRRLLTLSRDARAFSRFALLNTSSRTLSTTAVRRGRSNSPPVIQITKGTFYRNYPSPAIAESENPPFYPNLTWSLPSEKPDASSSSPLSSGDKLQHWAIIGSSGQSKFLEILRGQYIAIPPNSRTFPYLATESVKRSPSRAIQYVGFNGEQSQAAGGIRGAYLSARYESLREETDFTVQQYLEGKTELNPFDELGLSEEDQRLLDQVTTDLKLKELLSMPVANLSNGQTRRARIAKALLNRPEVLLLDEPFMGLDPPTVATLSPLLYNLAVKSEPRLVISLRPQDKIPEWINHVVFLGPNNTVALQGEKGDVLETLNIWKTVALETDQGKKDAFRSSLSEHAKEKYDHAQKLFEEGRFETKLGILNDVGMVSQSARPVLKDRETSGQGEPIIAMDGVNTYSLPLKLFGRSRLPEPGKPGLSIFDLQRKIGHSSPEVHAFFPRNLSLLRSLATAFADTFLAKPNLDDSKTADILASLLFFEADLNPDFKPGQQHQQPLSPTTDITDPKLSWIHDIRFSSLSVSQQRLILLLRALVHKPDLVVLDESFGGMAPSLRDKCLHYLEVGQRHATSTGSRRTLDFARVWNLPPQPTAEEMRFGGISKEQALVVISHVREEVPDIIGRWMVLPSPSVEAERGMVKQVDENGRLIYREGVLGEDETVAGEGWDRIWGLRED